MSKIVKLKCLCGTVRGTLKIVRKSSFHVHCLCCDCQSFASHLNNKKKILDKHGGSELFQTYPAFMTITDGLNKIACVQLKEKGLYRWHTTCCNMPVANTMNSSKVPFIGVSVKFMELAGEKEKLEVLGPVAVKAFGKYAIGKVPQDVHIKFPLSFLPKIFSFMLKGLFNKKGSPSPFFKDGQPIAKPTIL